MKVIITIELDRFGRVRDRHEVSLDRPAGWVAAEVDVLPEESGLHWYVRRGTKVGDTVTVGVGFGVTREGGPDNIRLMRGTVVAIAPEVRASRFAVQK